MSTREAPVFDADPEAVMAHHAKTFYWANRLMPRAYRRDFAILYAFCRMADDVVDRATDADAARVAAAEVAEGLDHPQTAPLHVRSFVELAERRGIPLEIARELLRGVGSDIGRVRIARERDLVRYSYRVASTVGLMVCHILDVRDPQALAFAIDLGIGMQLTNIARDVTEDMREDRIYLPAEYLPHDIVEAAVEGDQAARNQARCAILGLLDTAERYYRSGDHGMRYLPAWARRGIMTASRCYEAIGDVIRDSGDRYWFKRCFTSKWAKIRKTALAVSASALGPRYWLNARGPRHDPLLHDPLAGLPEADQQLSLSKP